MSITQETLIKLYRDNIDRIYKYFYFRTLNKEISEDLTSTSFLEFTKEYSKNNIDNPNAYLKGIAHNILNKHLRTKYKNREINKGISDIDNILIDKDNSKSKTDYNILLKNILPLLPLSQRKIIDMRFIQKLSIKEIAKKLKKDENYVSTTQKRAFISIKRILNVQKD